MRESLPLEVAKAENGAPAGEVIPGAVHSRAREKLPLARRVEATRRYQALLLPLRELLPLGVVVAEREFALVIVARLADRQRRRRTEHNASSVRPASVRLGQRSPSAGDL
jgi:hypothetical protein